MAIEIERKFLVQGRAWKSSRGVLYRQGYLNRHPERTVRVRIAGKKAFLTVKGLTRGASRLEFEYPIPFADAQRLLRLCEGPLVEKLRRKIRHRGLTWEIDEFLGRNKGLFIAEIELDKESRMFDRPEWCGPEVTHDPRYFNSNLAERPFREW